MSEISTAPDIGALDVPVDAWTEPFWAAAEKGELTLPRCTDCARFRWPPGPFCPHCHSQRVEWRASGPARVYSFTVVRNQDAKLHVPALVEFPEADGVRILAAIVDKAIEDIRIGAALRVHWSRAANVSVPIFSLA